MTSPSTSLPERSCAMSTTLAPMRRCRATGAEVEEARAVAVCTGGGPSLMYGVDAIAAFGHPDELPAGAA